MSGLESAVDRMQGAPLEVRRHLELIRVLDQRWFQKMGQLQRAQDNYLRRVREEKKKLGDDPKVDVFAATEDRPALDRIRTLRAEALQLATEKVLVAEQAYVTMRMRLERVARDYTSYRDAVRRENNSVPPELAGDPLLMYQHSNPPHGVHELAAAFDRRGRTYDDGAGAGAGFERAGSSGGAAGGGGGGSEFVTGEEMDQAVAAAAEGDEHGDDRGRGGRGWADGEAGAGGGAATSFVGSRGPGQGITLPPDVASSLRAASGAGGRGGAGQGRGRGAAAARDREESGPPSEAEDGEGGGGGDEKYCLCNRPAFGEMVGCDNDDCNVGNGWFHLSCVGLSAAPDGKWYCPDCTKKMELQAAARGRKLPPSRPGGGAAAGGGARR